MALRFCEECGAELTGDKRFCVECGAGAEKSGALPVRPVEVASPKHKAASRWILLSVTALVVVLLFAWGLEEVGSRTMTIAVGDDISLEVPVKYGWSLIELEADDSGQWSYGARLIDPDDGSPEAPIVGCLVMVWEPISLSGDGSGRLQQFVEDRRSSLRSAMDYNEIDASVGRVSELDHGLGEAYYFDSSKEWEDGVMQSRHAFIFYRGADEVIPLEIQFGMPEDEGGRLWEEGMAVIQSLEVVGELGVR